MAATRLKSARTKLLNRWHSTAVRDGVPWLALAAILAVALVLRLYGLRELTLFYGDQGRDSMVIWGMVQDGELPLIGPPVSLGTYQRGPAFYYLLAPAFALSGGDPAGGAVATALADVCTVFLLALFGRAVAGWPAGLAAAALWATAAWTTEFARFMWNPQLVPTFALLVLLALVGLGRKEPRWLILLVPAWIIAWQLHDQAVLLLPSILIWWIVVRPPVTPKIVMVSLAVAAVVALPFLLYEATHGLTNLRSMVTLVLADEGGSSAGASGSGLAGVIAGAGMLVPQNSVATPLFWAAALAGLVWLVLRMRGTARSTSILLILLTATTGLYAFWPGPIQTYYLYLVMPVPFLLVGSCLSFAWSRHRPLAIGLMGLVAVVAIGGVASTVSMLREQPQNPRTLGNMKSQIAAVAATAGNAPFAVRLVSLYDDFGSWDAPYRYLLDEMLGPSAGRVDLPTFVLYDSLELATNGGHVVAGARFVLFPAPSVGRELLRGTNGWRAIDTGAELSPQGADAILRIAPTSGDRSDGSSRAEREIRIRAEGQYLLAFEYRSAPNAKGCQVFAEVRDAGGTTLSTSFDPAGALDPSGSGWSSRSFFVHAQPGSAVIAVVLANTGMGTIDYRNVSLRAVTSPMIPGAAVR